MRALDLTDPADLPAWRAWAALVSDAARDAWGDDSRALDADQARSLLLADPERIHRTSVVQERGRVVGGLFLDVRAATAELARVAITVAPTHRRRGMASALLDHAHEQARSLGVARLRAGVDRGVADLPSAGEHFCAATGFVRYQTVRVSVLALGQVPVAPPAAGYHLVTYAGTPPPHLMPAIAALKTAMALDAPPGDVDALADPWDAERVAARYARTAASGSVLLTALALHGREVVGLSELVRERPGDDELVQADTIVTAAHRGHGLGIALKSRLLAEAPSLAPGARTTRTSNAVENAPMLAVNERLGYRRVGEWSQWINSVG